MVRNRKQRKAKKTKALEAAPDPVRDTMVRKRRRLPKTEAVVLDKPAGAVHICRYGERGQGHNTRAGHGL